MDFSQILCAGLVWTNRVCWGGGGVGREGMGWDELVDHILGRSASIYLSIYSLNLNPD
jgi:hypothetical protein